MHGIVLLVDQDVIETNQNVFTGTFYNFIGESRLGKGVAMNLLLKLGGSIDIMRKERYDAVVAGGNINEGEDDGRAELNEDQ